VQLVRGCGTLFFDIFLLWQCLFIGMKQEEPALEVATLIHEPIRGVLQLFLMTFGWFST
jgi:hypothetical protein